MKKSKSKTKSVCTNIDEDFVSGSSFHLRDSTIITICAIVGVIALALSVVAPPRVNEEGIVINATVLRVFHASGITIADVKLHSMIPIVFMDNTNIALGENLLINASIGRYHGKLELVVR